MDDLARVNILNASDQLINVVASLEAVHALASEHQVAQRLVVANVEQNVDVVFVFEVAIESHNVFMVQTSVDLDLAREFLTGLATGEVLLGNHFEGPSHVPLLLSLHWAQPLDLVGLGKPSLQTQK